MARVAAQACELKMLYPCISLVLCEYYDKTKAKMYGMFYRSIQLEIDGIN